MIDFTWLRVRSVAGHDREAGADGRGGDDGRATTRPLDDDTEEEAEHLAYCFVHASAEDVQALAEDVRRKRKEEP